MFRFFSFFSRVNGMTDQMMAIRNTKITSSINRRRNYCTKDLTMSSTLSRAFLILPWMLLCFGRHVQGHGSRGHSSHDSFDDHECGFRDSLSPMARQARGTLEDIHANFEGRRSRRLQGGDNPYDLYTDCNELCNQCNNIPIYAHFIGFEDFLPHPYSSVEQFLFDGVPVENLTFTSVDQMALLLQENVDHVNWQFRDTAFRFTLMEEISVSYNESQSKFFGDYMDEVSSVVHQGDTATLNLYLAFGIDTETSDAQTLGLAEFPYRQSENMGDGVFMVYEVVSGGGLDQYDSGDILVHEIGHWLGLYHTFENVLPEEFACDPDKNFQDVISDTPQQRFNTRDTGIPCYDILNNVTDFPDTCPNQTGVDPVFNFMNYVDDFYCFADAGSFTCEQRERMYRFFILYRDHVSNCADDEMEIELAISFDGDLRAFETEFYLAMVGGEARIIDSGDYDEGFQLEVFNNGLFTASGDGRVLAIDVCVPNTNDYEFGLMDFGGEDPDNDGFGEGDGFLTGFVEILRDGVLLQRFEGNFTGPQLFTIEASASANTNATAVATMAPTASPSKMTTTTSHPTEATSLAITSTKWSVSALLAALLVVLAGL